MKTLVTIAFVLFALAAITLRPDLGARAAITADVAAPAWDVSPKWINSEPLRVEALRGKVVLVDFWTYSCVNCLRTVPYLNQWYRRYKNDGLLVVGIHTPEFEFESKPVDVDDAVLRLGIEFPVAQDNQYSTWQRYNNVAWPAFYLIDRSGRIAFIQYGEGEYGLMENKLRKLLGINGEVPRDDGVDLSRIRTGEIYLGTEHESHQARQEMYAVAAMSHDSAYQLPNDVSVGEYAFDGSWSRMTQYAHLDSEAGTIVLRFNAAKVNLVAGAATPTELTIRVDDESVRRVRIDGPRMYPLYDGDTYREHLIRIEIPNRGLDAYSFTFG